ncbi:hypothetical protein [Spirosoma pulveris]
MYSPKTWALVAYTTLSLLTSTISSCKHTPTPGDEVVELPTQTPSTAIPDEFVGTWFASHNEGPLTINWEKGTFQGEQGFREFRTMVFTQAGTNALEYTSEVVNLTNGVPNTFGVYPPRRGC